MWAWGSNWFGQLGDGSTVDSILPVPISSLSHVVAVAASDSHSMAVQSDGSLWAWGANTVGQLGNGTTNDHYAPVAINRYHSMFGIISMAGGYEHSVAVNANGVVFAWGGNATGQVGDGTTLARRTPVEARAQSRTKHIDAGGMHSLRTDSGWIST